VISFGGYNPKASTYLNTLTSFNYESTEFTTLMPE